MVCVGVMMSAEPMICVMTSDRPVVSVAVCDDEW